MTKDPVAGNLTAQPTEGATPDQSLTVVGIGASAGGFSAIGAFLGAMPPAPDKAIAFVIVQHLSPDHKSILTELLKRSTEMSLFEAQDGMEVKPNCVYIIPPNRDLALLGGKLQLLELDLPRGVRHPIDFFFRSLAADKREHAICIVLSGTGSDGTLGLRAVKGEGGMVMAQSPDSTEFDGMPRSAIATGLVDYILPPAEMPALLISYVARISGNSIIRTTYVAKQSTDALAKIATLLRAKTGHDFSQYKEATIGRRVERRMALHQIEHIAEYVRFLQHNTIEVAALFRDLLIGVTCFFRDREAFSTFERVAIPRLIDRASSEGAIRAWVCGCSTGEEAYSIAILIHEQLERLQQSCKVQLFATDLDRHATDQARSGIFPASIASDISSERLKRFFRQDTNGFYRIDKAIRDQLIFSEQDVLKDPPFSRLHLISCRNLLIYLNAEVQKRLIPLFHYALNPEGMLFLGSAETIGEHPFLFDVLDRQAKLYARKQNASPPGSRFFGLISPHPRIKPILIAEQESPRSPKFNFRQLTEHALLDHFAVAAVLVDRLGEIVYFHGRTGNYLEPAPGEAASNVLAMARDGLRRDLTLAFQRVVTKREPAYLSGLQAHVHDQQVLVNLTILPARISGPELPDLYLVIFDEKPPLIQQPAVGQETLLSSDEGPPETRITSLEQKLRAKDEYIQNIIEQMQTSDEELRSSNEELQSVNEEMQSANEELETSREELQSLNEELATVNTELQQKLTDLARANNDMNNLLAGTGVGTLFVDHQLRIARFTPSITHIINFIESDVGRPFADIVSNVVGYDRLLIDVQSVLDTLVPVEVEVQTKAASWYILSIRPYRTLENVIEGVVITFVDITKRKFAEQALQEAERFRHAAQIETVGIAFFRIDGPITSANEAFLHMVRYSPEDLEAGKLSWDAITPTEYLPAHLKSLEDLKVTGRTLPYERDYLRKDGSCGTALFASWRLPEGDAVVYVIGVAPNTFPQAFTRL